jgi:ankyrin repeat protein
MATIGNIKVIKYLVSKGVNIHILNKATFNCYLIAVYYGNIRLMNYLESIGVNIHKKTYNGNNAHLIATYYGNIRLMKYLEKKGVNIYSRNSGNLNFLENRWPCSNKIAPYVFKNMNYKLNRYKIEIYN